MIHGCETCGISKESLKSEINEVMPDLIARCNRGVVGHSLMDHSTKASYEIGVGLLSGDAVSPNYAVSAGVLEEKIRSLQHQVDLNFAEIQEAKAMYDREARYQQQLIDRNFAEINQAKDVYEREVDYLLKVVSYL